MINSERKARKIRETGRGTCVRNKSNTVGKTCIQTHVANSANEMRRSRNCKILRNVCPKVEQFRECYTRGGNAPRMRGIFSIGGKSR